MRYTCIRLLIAFMNEPNIFEGFKSSPAVAIGSHIVRMSAEGDESNLYFILLASLTLMGDESLDRNSHNFVCANISSPCKGLRVDRQS